LRAESAKILELTMPSFIEFNSITAEVCLLESKLERQAAEIDSMRKALEQRNSDVKLYKEQCGRLAEENGSLRDACKAAWGCAHTYTVCDECESIFGDCIVKKAMRDIGIEV
jgi:plasmid replication initiation protein